MRDVSIHIDGSYFLKRLPDVRPDFRPRSVDDTVKGLRWLVSGHLKSLNKIARHEDPRALLYRIFYYDAHPLTARLRKPISGEVINFATTPENQFRKQLFARLRRESQFAVRLGTVYKERDWRLSEQADRRLRDGRMQASDLTDDDYFLTLRQKGVDARIGLDITSVVLKKQARTVVLVTGDSDFVPVAKLARREGCTVILDPVWQTVKPELFEHIDGLWNGLGRHSSDTNP